MGKNLKITSISKLKEYAKGEPVELPPFSENQPFVARVKRPSMMNMVKNGKIPNRLLVKANDLFMSGGKRLLMNDEALLSDMFAIVDTIAKDFFVEPTYSEIVDAGIELTDDQMMFIFNYTQKGVEVLVPFHTESEDRECNSDSEEI